MKAVSIGVLSLIASSLFSGEIRPEGLVLIDSFSGVRDHILQMEERLDWHTDLKSAFEEAKQSKKAVLVVVLGSKNCPWSEKLSQEVLYQKAFLDPLEQQVVFYVCELSLLQKSEEAFVKEHDI